MDESPGPDLTSYLTRSPNLAFQGFWVVCSHSSYLKTRKRALMVYLIHLFHRLASLTIRRPASKLQIMSRLPKYNMTLANSKFSSWDWAKSVLKFLRISSLKDKKGISPTCKFLRVATEERNASAASYAGVNKYVSRGPRVLWYWSKPVTRLKYVSLWNAPNITYIWIYSMYKCAHINGFFPSAFISQMNRLRGLQIKVIPLDFVNHAVAKEEIPVVEVLPGMNHGIADNDAFERKRKLQPQGRRRGVDILHLSRTGRESSSTARGPLSRRTFKLDAAPGPPSSQIMMRMQDAILYISEAASSSRRGTPRSLQMKAAKNCPPTFTKTDCSYCGGGRANDEPKEWQEVTSMNTILTAMRSADEEELYSHLKQLKYLLSVGADPDALDSNGKRPLHVCMEMAGVEACQVILLCRPNIQAVDFDGKTALGLEFQNQHLESGFQSIAKLACQKHWYAVKNLVRRQKVSLVELNTCFGSKTAEQWAVHHGKIQMAMELCYHAKKNFIDSSSQRKEEINKLQGMINALQEQILKLERWTGFTAASQMEARKIPEDSSPETTVTESSDELIFDDEDKATKRVVAVIQPSARVICQAAANIVVQSQEGHIYFGFEPVYEMETYDDGVNCEES
ncbi:unnamed protein product [Notodromas monacha]|uniref:Uncharacterized protein n=1 Tax=Notodromas monacha TaxID=399045 RepID=A0A7R9GEZ8_9CRUS|nr:unnamed protein product [Notodromas monacha]CAG0918355.1 unnamed protein product [Notodromas monacha]